MVEAWATVFFAYDAMSVLHFSQSLVAIAKGFLGPRRCALSADALLRWSRPLGAVSLAACRWGRFHRPLTPSLCKSGYAKEATCLLAT
eukprot:3918533-Prymnesium_polylepis.2